MSTLTLILSAIAAAFQFPAELGAFIILIQKTPEQNRQGVLAAIQKESDAIDQTGRPTWGA